MSRFAHVALVFLLVSAPMRAYAQDDETSLQVADQVEEEEQVELWDESWGRSGIPNYTLIGATALSIVINIIHGSFEDRPNTGRNDFDEGVRTALRLPEEQQRLVIRDFSDGLLTLATSTPVLFDALILAAWRHESEDTALQMILMHAEVVSTTLALQTLANVLVSRERPYGRTCGGTGPDDFDEDNSFCDTPSRYYSFFSGHTSQSFASAAVLCSFHMNMPLLGDGPENTVVPCVAGFAVAGATSVFRILGDMHYASDVLTGAVMGTTIGFLMPWLLHFNPRAQERSDDDVQVILAPAPNGITVMGVF